VLDRRVPQQATRLHLLSVKSRRIVGGDRLHDVMHRQRGLQDDPPAGGGRPREIHRINQQLMGPFSRTKIREVQSGVGIDDSNETNRQNRLPLKQCLRPDQDVPGTGMDLLPQSTSGHHPTSRVAINSENPRPRTKPVDFLLDPFRPFPNRTQA
jgi:hypothetical protein